MPFRDSLYDGSEPDYAPGISWSKDWAFWRPTAKYKRAGYKIERISLPGRKGDGRDHERAALCREYTRDMLAWYTALDEPRVEIGSWHEIFARYRGDTHSPIRDVKANTRENYLWLLSKWEGAIGHMKMARTTYAEIMAWKDAMKAKGRSDAYVKRMFTMLRIVVRYGSMIEHPDAARIAAILSAMRIRNPPRRQVQATRQHVYAVIEAAEAEGRHAFALGLMIQFEFMLRAVDVRGQWLPAEGAVGGIQHNGKRWADGLTWEMVDRDCTSFRKVISKTARSMPEPLTFDLTVTPRIMERLAATPQEKRAGPVIVSESGLPYGKHQWSHLWRRFAKKAGVPDNVWMMDTRAGAVTEGASVGADPISLRNAAQHSNVTTTDRYARGRDASIRAIAEARQKNAGRTE